MLFADKEQLETDLTVSLLAIRERELNLYTQNCRSIATQTSVLAGFAYGGCCLGSYLFPEDVSQSMQVRKRSERNHYHSRPFLSLRFLIQGVARLGHGQLRGCLALRRVGWRPLRGAGDRRILQIDRPRSRAIAAGVVSKCLVIVSVWCRSVIYIEIYYGGILLL